jgi:hypothetical protein
VSDADCDDDDPCTVDICIVGTCEFVADESCTPCVSDGDCDDGDTCTTDTCNDGACDYTPVPGCSPELCDNGLDDDGNGLVDCQDPECADALECREPAGVSEICGDCLDNDGDGLVDYEDPDCCAEPSTLNVRRLVLRSSTKKVRDDRLRVWVRYAKFRPSGFDPTTQDTSIQVSGPDGQIFCKTIAADTFKHRERWYAFRVKKHEFEGGLRKGRFKVKRNGRILFSTRGKKMSLPVTPNGEARVTLRVGDQCAQTTGQLRTKAGRPPRPVLQVFP